MDARPAQQMRPTNLLFEACVLFTTGPFVNETVYAIMPAGKIWQLILSLFLPSAHVRLPATED